MLEDMTWIPKGQPIKKESDVHPHVAEDKSQLYFSSDGGSTEYEVLNWIYANIRLLKPEYVLETGSYEGLGTVALAHACKMNGFGKVITIENNPKQCVKVESMIEENNLQDYAVVECFDSLQYLSMTNYKFGLGFFDSATEIRAKECEICLNRKIISNIAVFHDTSPFRVPEFTLPHIQQKYRSDVFELARNPHCSGVTDFHYSRGFMALWIGDNHD